MSALVRRLVVGSTLFAICAPWVSSVVGWEDSAFFQLCHATLGVPHGPGFPLYVLLGRLFAWPFTTPALGSNLLSAAAFAASGVLLHEILLLLGRAKDSARAPHPWGPLAAFAVVMGWAALPIHLPQATRAEVYTLVLFLVLGVCYASLRAQQEHKRSWAFTCVAAWCWGLALAVHPLIAVAAGTPWLILAARPWRKRWFMVALFALAPMSLYLFPILRGRIDGVWAWGNFDSLASSFDYFTRRTAWNAVVATDGGWRENLAGWATAAPELFTSLLWVPAVWGLWLLRKLWPFLLSFAAVVLLVIWAAPFDPANLDLLGYFLPAVAMLAAGLGFFCLHFAARLWPHWTALSLKGRVVFGLCFAFVAASWPASSLILAAHSGPSSLGASRLTQSLDAALPDGATLFVSEDNFLGVLEYSRAVGFRPDLEVISLGALRHPHYRRMLAGRIDNRLSSGWEFEQIWSENVWKDQVRQLWPLQQPGESWFVQFERLPGLEPATLQPRGFVAALSGSNATSWQAGLNFWKAQASTALSEGPERSALARWIFNFGVLALEAGHSGTGWEALHLALEVSPKEPEMYYLLGQALERAGRSTDARVLLSAAVEMAPYRERYRRALESVSPHLAVQP